MAENSKFANIMRKTQPQFWPEADPPEEKEGYPDTSGKARLFSKNNPPTLTDTGARVARKKGEK